MGQAFIMVSEKRNFSRPVPVALMSALSAASSHWYALTRCNFLTGCGGGAPSTSPMPRFSIARARSAHSFFGLRLSAGAGPWAVSRALPASSILTRSRLRHGIVSAGFLCLMAWAFLSGQFKRIEEPKHAMLKRALEQEALEGYTPLEDRE